MTSGKQDNKPYFRSAAKRAAYDCLETQLRAAQRRLTDNRYKIHSLAKEQTQLKADVAALHQCMHEIFGGKK